MRKMHHKTGSKYKFMVAIIHRDIVCFPCKYNVVDSLLVEAKNKTQGERAFNVNSSAQGIPFRRCMCTDACTIQTHTNTHTNRLHSGSHALSSLHACENLPRCTLYGKCSAQQPRHSHRPHSSQATAMASENRTPAHAR